MLHYQVRLSYGQKSSTDIVQKPAGSQKRQLRRSIHVLRQEYSSVDTGHLHTGHNSHGCTSAAAENLAFVTPVEEELEESCTISVAGIPRSALAGEDAGIAVPQQCSLSPGSSSVSANNCQSAITAESPVVASDLLAVPINSKALSYSVTVTGLARRWANVRPS